MAFKNFIWGHYIQIFIHLVNQNMQKVQNWLKISKIGSRKTFEYSSGFDGTKTFVLLFCNLIKIIRNFSSHNFLPKLLVFDILNFKNADFCLEVHLIKIAVD